MQTLEHFPKSGNRFLDKKCGKNNKLEHLVENRTKPNALAVGSCDFCQCGLRAKPAGDIGFMGATVARINCITQMLLCSNGAILTGFFVSLLQSALLLALNKMTPCLVPASISNKA